MKYFYLILLMLLFSVNSEVAGQTSEEIDSDKLFDFWLGQWNLSWEGRDGEPGSGTNHIEYILNEKVIKENFSATKGNLKGYKGISFSVNNSKTGEWKQTWVDNQGGYLDFIGMMEGEKRIFIRDTEDREGRALIQRMVFYDITPDSFTWDWESSKNDGKSWNLQWRIYYSRNLSE